MNINEKERDIALGAIKKKLVGHSINYDEAYAIMHQFCTKGLGDIFVAYFAASSFKNGYTDDELYFLTKAMVETGSSLDFKGIVADKHSIGGLPGTRATMIIVPIIAAAGFTIPKTSSRAITTPAGTADCMEVFAPVELDLSKVQEVVKKTGGCIVWGGKLGIAPADDIIIRVQEPLGFESFDKVMVSILAKKVAASSKLLVLDIPVGPTMKMKYVKDALSFADRFVQLALRFGITTKVDINYQYEPSGHGVGPLLEARDALSVLEQQPDRPRGLEHKAIKLASRLLDMCFQKAGRHEDGLIVAEELLYSKKALTKFKEIIREQGGNPDVTSRNLSLAPFRKEIVANEGGKVSLVNNFHITEVAKLLGAPGDKRAGIFLHKRFGDTISKRDILFEIYSESKEKLERVSNELSRLPIYEII